MNELCSRLLSSPQNYLEAPYDQGFELSASQLAEIHLTGARRAFEAMRGRVPALTRLATECNVSELSSFGGLAKVLFPHTVYKSYPLSVLERGEFSRLAAWLNELTCEDLTRVDVRDAATLDDWIACLDETTDLRVVHSFGTTGKLSIIPRSREEWLRGGTLIGNCIRDWHGGNGVDLRAARLPFVHPFYRFGASAAARGVDMLVELYADHDDAGFMYPRETFSADVASVAGRLAGMRASDTDDGARALRRPGAKRRGAAAGEDRRRQLRRFATAVREKLAGRDVYLFAIWPLLYEWAQEGLSSGIRGLFGSNSILHTGGGDKGLHLPHGWKSRIFEFLGFDRHFEFYTMTELIPACPRCDAGNYHIPPVLVPMLLDARSGEVLPRDGERTGRFAFFDLLATSYWGGFITGDEVTLTGWQQPCACGRGGPYVLPTIRRLSQAEGGDDKVNCGGVAQPYAEALTHLATREPETLE